MPYIERFDKDRFVAVLQAKARDYPLREVALQTGISAATLSRLERGKAPDLETFFAVCSWLGAAPDQFMKLHEHEKEGGAFCISCILLRQRLAAIARLANDAVH